MIAVSCQELTKYFGKNRILNEMSFSIQENTITGIIGRNGAGKTSLLKTIAGYWRSSAGEIKVFGHDPFNSLEVSANCIMIDDGMYFQETLGLWDIFEWAEAFYPNWDQGLAERLFAYFQFQRYWAHHNLSKGNKSTFNMIVGLASRCALTIFDEPTIGMDASVRADFYRALLKDYLAHPRTILLSSHHLEEVEHLLEDVMLIDQGTCKLHMPIDELQMYAISIEGPADLIREWTDGCETMHEQKNELERLHRIVLRNTISGEALEALNSKGVEVAKVSAADVCIYSTNARKGGIDDVFTDDAFK